MKKILSLIIAAALLISVVALFAACGNNAGNEIKDDMTSMMDDATTLMDSVSDGISDLADDLTENGNVTGEAEDGKVTGESENGATNQDATNEGATSGENEKQSEKTE